MIGDEDTDRYTKDFMIQVMHSIAWKNKKGRIIELMAGTGRLHEVYASLFTYYEMLDGVRQLLL